MASHQSAINDSPAIASIRKHVHFVRCTDEETVDHLAYLEAHNPNTADLQLRLRLLGWPLYAADVSVAELGELDTWWGNLGTGDRGETAIAVIGRRWYRVQDGFAAIARACLPDSDDARKVAYFTTQEAAGSLVPRITLIREDLDTGPNYRIADGNHQAVAIFELRRSAGCCRGPILRSPRQAIDALSGATPRTSPTTTGLSPTGSRRR